jgi:CheY-like chemotaxis protein
MSGVALAEILKNDPRFGSIPIILMSAAGRPSGGHVADYFLAKPFDLNLLADLIERYA